MFKPRSAPPSPGFGRSALRTPSLICVVAPLPPLLQLRREISVRCEDSPVSLMSSVDRMLNSVTVALHLAMSLAGVGTDRLQHALPDAYGWSLRRPRLSPPVTSPLLPSAGRYGTLPLPRPLWSWTHLPSRHLRLYAPVYPEYSSPPPHRPLKPLRNLRRMGCQVALLCNGGLSPHGRPRRPRLSSHQLLFVRLLPPETRDLATNRRLKPLDQIPSAWHKNASTPLTSPLRNLHRRSQRGRTCPAN